MVQKWRFCTKVVFFYCYFPGGELLGSFTIHVRLPLMPKSQKLPKWRIVNLLVERLGPSCGIDPNGRISTQLVARAAQAHHPLSASSLQRWHRDQEELSSFQANSAEALAVVFKKGCPDISASWFQTASTFEDFEHLLLAAIEKNRPRTIPDHIDAAYRLIRPDPFFGPQNDRLIIETTVVWRDEDETNFALFSPVHGEQGSISRIAFVGTRRQVGSSIVLEGSTDATEVNPFSNCFLSLHARHEARDPLLNSVRALTYHGFDAFSGDPWCGLCFSHQIKDGAFSVPKIRESAGFSSIKNLNELYPDTHEEIKRFLLDADGQSPATLHLRTSLFNERLGFLGPLEGDFYEKSDGKTPDTK